MLRGKDVGPRMFIRRSRVYTTYFLFFISFFAFFGHVKLEFIELACLSTSKRLHCRRQSLQMNYNCIIEDALMICLFIYESELHSCTLTSANFPTIPVGSRRSVDPIDAYSIPVAFP